jgi:hypothetical protein
MEVPMFEKWFLTNLVTAVLLFILLPISFLAEGTAFWTLLIGVSGTLWVISQIKLDHYYRMDMKSSAQDHLKSLEALKSYQNQVQPGVTILDRLDKISHKILTADQLVSVNNEPSARLGLLLDKLEADIFGKKSAQTPFEPMFPALTPPTPPPGIVTINETAETNPAPQ